MTETRWTGCKLRTDFF